MLNFFLNRIKLSTVSYRVYSMTIMVFSSSSSTQELGVFSLENPLPKISWTQQGLQWVNKLLETHTNVLTISTKYICTMPMKDICIISTKDIYYLNKRYLLYQQNQQNISTMSSKHLYHLNKGYLYYLDKKIPALSGWVNMFWLTQSEYVLQLQLKTNVQVFMQFTEASDQLRKRTPMVGVLRN